VEKILVAGYYWPTIFKDIFYYFKRYKMCQVFMNKFTGSGNLHLFFSLGPFEKWGIDLMGHLSVIKKGHRFIVVATDYLTKFVKVRALKTSVKKEVGWFVYKRIITRFGILLEMVSDNERQFTSSVYKDLMERLAIKHKFTTMYKLNTNGLV
jgi:hypothetical protein